MGALSNSGRKAANLTGFYKGIQSAGAAVFWRLDALKKPYDTMFGATVSCLKPPQNHPVPSPLLRPFDSLLIRKTHSGALSPAPSSSPPLSCSSRSRTRSRSRRISSSRMRPWPTWLLRRC